MVSLRMVLLNLLRVRHSPRCVVSIGKYTNSVPYIISAERSDRVIIGKYCSIGHGVILVPHPGHIPSPEYRDYRVANYAVTLVRAHGFKPSYYLPCRNNFIFIGNDVWIGANVIVLPGVKIGDGAIVGAGAVVSHDVPPYAVAAGVPAKVLRYRYRPEVIEKLLKIAWWNWSEDKIYHNMDYFYGKVDDFVGRFYQEGNARQ